MSGEGYKIVYDVHRDGISLGDIPPGKGGTDALFFVSIVRSDGAVSYQMTGVDGDAKDEELSATERWKVWLHLAHALAEDKTLRPNQRELCSHVFETVRLAILEQRRREN